MNAEHWDDRYNQAKGDGAGLWAAQPHQQLQQIAGELSPGRALDLATGDGRNAIWLAHHEWQVTAVDFSDTGLDIARQRAAAENVSVDWKLADVTQWSPEQLFDLVTITYLHLADDMNATVIQRASQWVAPGGTLLVIGHDKDNIAHGTGGPQDPAVLYSPEMLRAATSLHIVAAQQVTRDTTTDPEGPQDSGSAAIDTLLHAVNPAS